MYDERMKLLRTDGLSSGYDGPRQEKSKRALSDSPTRPMSDGTTMGGSSTYDRLKMWMDTQKVGASSITRLQPQLMSSSLGLTPVLATASDLSDKFAGVMTGLEELRHDMTKRMDRVEEGAQKGHQERLRDELTNVKSQARIDQAQLIRDTDQCLAESLAMATKESQERDVRMTREIQRLLNDHDTTYGHTKTNLEKRLDAKTDLLMRKLDEILSGSNRQSRPASTRDSRRATNESRTHNG